MDRIVGSTDGYSFGSIGRTLSSFKPAPCSVCGKNMRMEDGAVFIGMHLSINIDGATAEDIAEAGRKMDFYKEQLGVYADLLDVCKPVELDICWECWFKSLGVPVPVGPVGDLTPTKEGE